MARPLAAIVMVLMSAAPGRAEIGVFVQEPISLLGALTRVGHAATYFSNICPDGSPIRMRLCRPGEGGGVVSKYAPLSEHENFDWAIVPLEAYLHGAESPDLAPLIGTPALQAVLERAAFGPLFSSALTSGADGRLPTGQWKAALATRFDRTLYLFSVDTSAADDTFIVSAFNALPNQSQFNFFYRNCSDQAKRIFDLILPRAEGIGDRESGITMQTPKGLAKALVVRAREHPELHLRVTRYPQLPGAFARSRPVLFPMENTYRNPFLAPWLLFGGFREVALVSLFYHQVVSPFELREAFEDYLSPDAARLTMEQDRLRSEQDALRRAASSVRTRDSSREVLTRVEARVFDRLEAIRHEKRAEVDRVVGSRARWRAHEQEFRSIVRGLGPRLSVPAELERRLVQAGTAGVLSEHLVRYFERHGEFFMDGSGRGPWMRLPLADGTTGATGVSASQVLAGDPRVAALVLIAAIDHNLHAVESHREGIERIDALSELLHQAALRLARQ